MVTVIDASIVVDVVNLASGLGCSRSSKRLARKGAARRSVLSTTNARSAAVTIVARRLRGMASLFPDSISPLAGEMQSK